MRELDDLEIFCVSGAGSGPNDYCGPQGRSISALIPESIAGVSFSDACRQHDLDFSPGSQVSIKDANQKFLRAMLVAAEGNAVATAAAYVYYGFAQILGGLFYEGAGEEKTGSVSVVFYNEFYYDGGSSGASEEEVVVW